MNEADVIWQLLWWVLWLLSLIHVYWEASRLNEPAFRISLMVAVCFWPLGYLLWVIYWPGNLRRKLQGKGRLKAVPPKASVVVDIQR
ncbi:hypothetical protein DDZ13_04085 [Coraliomargarita sinensis]|uniref:Uncharacterized protein n=1 Tax=Coraliomargarita sinensis TaxID=2174842 RepID=A0A317ZMI0_9BACT|nr:hypothetical protein DDZ13_04085 [Coraliomargarita sinensis]